MSKKVNVKLMSRKDLEARTQDTSISDADRNVAKIELSRRKTLVDAVAGKSTERAARV